MSTNKRKAVFVSFLVCALFFGSLPGVQRAVSAPPENEALIEVAGPGIAYVPMSAKRVKYAGIVREILGFCATVNAAMEDCKCPECCDGRCYVIIYTDLPLPTGPVKVLYILWMKC